MTTVIQGQEWLAAVVWAYTPGFSVPLPSCAVTAGHGDLHFNTALFSNNYCLKRTVHFWWNPVYGAFICYTI
jgi:hypothetical protein